MPNVQFDTISLDPKYREPLYEYDRQFQKYSIEQQLYCVPIDDEEEERLSIQHHIINTIFDENLIFGTVKNPERILDCGYGLASWAIAVAEKYPDCEVTGIDIHPLDLLDCPENLNLECDDLNQSLTEVYPSNTYDVIQSRFIGPGIHKNRWRTYMQDLFRLLKPGGCLQMTEYYYNIQSDTGLLKEDNALYEWGRKYRAAMERDRDPRVGNKLVEFMRRAGLVNVQHRYTALPIGGWRGDEIGKRLGHLNLGNVDRMLDSFAMWPFVARLGMSKNDVLALCDRARQEARDPNLHAYIPLHAVWGRKAESQ